MPQALPFSEGETSLISQGSTRQRVNRVLSAQFADGYSQEAPDGINPNYDVWNITYVPLNASERATVWAALDAVGASDYLTWQPPGSATSKKWKVVKDSVSETPVSGDLYTVSFQLRQVF
ncbi:phage tail protein [Ramlibacter sp. AN1015]|uniref:phage tail protein n=1 Tax=Ramlibacter sp. AN1015 TaxID=3133428 RepID=UPI00404098FB